MRQIRGLILAAGRGSRLGGLTNDRPKCLVRIGGRALLDWQLHAMRTAGVQEVAIVRGYRGRQIERSDLTCFDNRDWADSNMVHSLCCAADWLRRSDCIVSYGDIVFHPDLVSNLLRESHDIAVLYDELWEQLWRSRFESPLEDAESFRVANGQIVDIGRRPCGWSEIEGQYLGLFKLTPAGWASMEQHLSRRGDRVKKRMDVTSLLRELIVENIPIAAVPIRGRWCEVDRPADLRLYESIIRSQRAWSHDWRFRA